MSWGDWNLEPHPPDEPGKITKPVKKPEPEAHPWDVRRDIDI